MERPVVVQVYMATLRQVERASSLLHRARASGLPTKASHLRN
jgi:hypothetical protein